MIIKNDGTVIANPPRNNEQTLKYLSKFWSFITQEEYEKERQKIILREKPAYTCQRGELKSINTHSYC